VNAFEKALIADALAVAKTTLHDKVQKHGLSE